MTLIMYIVKRIQKGSICESDARAGGGSPPRRVLGVAGTLFSGRGFDGIRVADFMKGACLKTELLRPLRLERRLAAGRLVPGCSGGRGGLGDSPARHTRRSKPWFVGTCRCATATILA